jgi:hypothetical protein
MALLRKSSLLFWLAALTVWATLATPARADIILYNNRAAFNAATTGATTFNFDGLAPINSFTFFGAGPVTVDGVSFTTAGNSNIFAIGRDFAGGLFAFDAANVVLQDNTMPSNFTATLPPGTTAFGVDLGSQATITGTGTLTLASGGVFNFPITIPGRPGLEFLGVTSTEPIASFTVATGDFGLSFADVTLAQTNIPEPSSLALLGLGIAALAGWRRRRRKQRGE